MPSHSAFDPLCHVGIRVRDQIWNRVVPTDPGGRRGVNAHLLEFGVGSHNEEAIFTILALAGPIVATQLESEWRTWTCMRETASGKA
jgi:hypothetical protein